MQVGQVCRRLLSWTASCYSEIFGSISSIVVTWQPSSSIGMEVVGGKGLVKVTKLKSMSKEFCFWQIQAFETGIQHNYAQNWAEITGFGSPVTPIWPCQLERQTVWIGSFLKTKLLFPECLADQGSSMASQCIGDLDDRQRGKA